VPLLLHIREINQPYIQNQAYSGGTSDRANDRALTYFAIGLAIRQLSLAQLPDRTAASTPDLASVGITQHYARRKHSRP